MFPIFPRALNDLRRLGWRTWQATDNDPQFTIRWGFWRPRFLSIRLEGLDGPLDPVVYFDSGHGYSEDESRPLPRAERIVCVVALGRLPKLRRIRLDPAAQPTKFRLSVVGTRRLWRARKLARQFFGDAPYSPAIFELIDDREWRVAGPVDGSPARQNSVEHHLHYVIALAAQSPAARHDGGVPLVSLIVPTYNSQPRHLDRLLMSVRDRQDIAAELIFSDDGSSSEETLAWLDDRRGESDVVVVRNRLNRGTAAATNAALAVARGTWIGLVDHDDALVPFALKMFAHALAARPDAAFVYTDEVVANSDLHPVDYFLKPAFDPVLLSGVNYINHLSFFRRDRLVALGGLENDFQGSQDYDLLLRYLDGLTAREIVHIPYPAYFWRRHDAAYSTVAKATATDSARRALARHHARHGAMVTVTPALLPDLHRVSFDRGRADWPLVSIVIPNRDAFRFISTLLTGLADGTDYPELEIVVIDNGSTDARVVALYERCKTRFRSFRYHLATEAFNFSRAVNRGMAMTSGAYVLLLNNDIEIVEPGWLKEMVTCFAYSATGIVGARLLYPDRRVQHAGVIVGLGGLAGHWFGKETENHAGPMGRLAVRQTLSAVTGAAMLISRACLDATGRFDEDAFGIAYNDVDFCLRARAFGFRTVWTPFATLIHHESASRGSDETPQTIARFRREQENLRRRHGTDTYEDDAFNPWYSRDRSRPIYRYLATLPDCR